MAISNVDGPVFYLSAVAGVTIDPDRSATERDSVRYPINNMLDRVHPLRIFLSTQPTPQNLTVVFNIPTGVTIDGVFVDNVNVDGEFKFSTYTSGSVETVQAPAQTAMSTKDYRDGRRKCFVTFPTGLYFDGTSKRSFGVGFKAGSSLVSINNFADVFIGAVSFYSNSSRIVYPGGYANDIELEVVDPVTEIKFDGGAPEYLDIGEKYITLKMPDREFLEETQESVFFSILDNKVSPILYFENESNHSHAYVCRLDLTKGTKYAQIVRGKVFKSSLSLVECL